VLLLQAKEQHHAISCQKLGLLRSNNRLHALQDTWILAVAPPTYLVTVIRLPHICLSRARHVTKVGPVILLAWLLVLFVVVVMIVLLACLVLLMAVFVLVLVLVFVLLLLGLLLPAALFAGSCKQNHKHIHRQRKAAHLSKRVTLVQTS